MLKLNTLRAASEFSALCAGYAAVLGTLLCLMAPRVVDAQNIVKWVDAQGQTHYSDHAPTGQDAEAVSVHVARQKTVPVAAEETPNVVVIRRSTATTSTTANDSAATRAAEEVQRQAERQEAAEAAKAQADKDVVDKCNQAHETFCNQGADTIRQRYTTIAEIQYADAISARQDRISRGLRPGALPQPPP